MRRTTLGAGLALLALATAGCRQDMHDQPKVEPLEASRFFADGRGSRALPTGTVPRGGLRDDDWLYRGVGPEGTFAVEPPFEVTREVVERGRERFEIFCSPCHGRAGDGQGMIVARGFKRPETFHQDRLRSVPLGYYFDVMTNGFGQMSDYRAQVPVEDRWAIALYIQALQLSQQAPADRLKPEERERLAAPAAAPAAPATEAAEGTHR